MGSLLLYPKRDGLPGRERPTVAGIPHFLLGEQTFRLRLLRLRDHCRRPDAPQPPAEVPDPQGVLRWVRRLLHGVLVLVLHHFADGEAHGRLRHVCRPVLQRDGLATARSSSQCRRASLWLDGLTLWEARLVLRGWCCREV